MYKTLIFLFIFLSSDVLFSQNVNKYDKILNIEKLPFNNYEVRIYRKHAISTGLDMFRLYQDHNNWVGEWYETVATQNQKVQVKKSSLHLSNNPELFWIKIIDTDILHLPHWESIQYKLEKKNKEYFTDDGENMVSRSKSVVVDGVSYYVKIKRDKTENEFEYDNPESYLTIYPNVDELISFRELLDVLRSEFKVFDK